MLSTCLANLRGSISNQHRVSQKEITVTGVGEAGITGTDSDGVNAVANFTELGAISLVEIGGRKTAKNAGKAIGTVALSALVVGAVIAGAFGEFSYAPLR